VIQPVGEHLKYLVWATGRPIACLAWSSAPRHLGSRDRYIGWDAAALRSKIRFIAYNTRFLILPWVRVEHLASHILGRMAARISDDWQQVYGHPITKKENPRLCRGGSNSLTFPGVHPETLRREPPSTRRGETGWTSMPA
jgi:hypothetical protein